VPTESGIGFGADKLCFKAQDIRTCGGDLWGAFLFFLVSRRGISAPAAGISGVHLFFFWFQGAGYPHLRRGSLGCIPFPLGLISVLQDR